MLVNGEECSGSSSYAAAESGKLYDKERCWNRAIMLINDDEECSGSSSDAAAAAGNNR
jgi:hypothetical protein